MRLLLAAAAVVLGVGCHGGATTPPGPDPVPHADCKIQVREPLVAPTSEPSIGVAVGDVDGDAHPDVLVTHHYTLGVLRGAASGGLNAEITSPAGPSPDQVTTGDFDHDGHLDVAVTESNDNEVGVMAGNGDGTFDAPVMVTTGMDPQRIAAGDINGDGWIDLVVANRDGGTISVLGNTAGAFAPIATLTAGTPFEAMGLADLDHDGDLDIVAAYNFSTITSYLNDGHGTFTTGPTQTIPGGNDTSDLVLADFDGDGAIDLAASHFGGLPELAPVSVLLGRGDGSFADEVRYFTDDIQNGLAAGDIDGDHVIDLVTSDNWNASVTVLIGRGDGTFHDPVMLAAAGILGSGIAITDLDNDQKGDVVLAAHTAATVTALFGHAGALPDAPVLYPVGGHTAGGVIADLDGDGANDIAVATSGSDSMLRLVWGDGHGAGEIATVPATNPNVVAAGDVTGDGIADLVVGDAIDQQLYVLEASGGRTFTTHPPIAIGGAPQAIALGDLDGDGKLDVVVAAGNLVTLRNTGHGSFGSPTSVDPGVVATSLALGDVDGDHHLDVVAGADGAPWGTGSDDTPSTGPGTPAGIAVLRGNGTGALGAATTYPAGNGRVRVALGDLDGDGAVDLAATSALDDTVAIWRGNGHGAFTAGPTYDAGLAPASIEIVDVTGDASPDLLIGDLGNTVDVHFAISILPNHNDGTFGPREVHTASDHPEAALAGDLDRDRHADITVVHADTYGQGHGTLLMLLETCRPL